MTGSDSQANESSENCSANEEKGNAKNHKKLCGDLPALSFPGQKKRSRRDRFTPNSPSANM